MTPYGSVFYFGLLLYLAIPVLVASWFEVKPRRYILAATLVIVVVQFGLGPLGLAIAPLRDIGKVVGFAVGQWAVAALFLRLRRAGPNRAVFYSAVLVALLPLALEKFMPRGTSHLVAFMGISYLTFRALDVVFAVQDGLVKELPAAEYFSFLLFFPAISAGPIDRYRRFRTDYRKPRSRDELLWDLDQATDRIFRGLLYSFVIAPLINFYWLTPSLHRYGLPGVASYMYAYSLHLFFDFAGYSAFAIGVGYLFGIRMPENFNQPFLAKNITDFWNRWHISLSSFLRDHVYGRFVLAATKGRWFKDRQLASYLGSVLAFGLMGVWHGTAARYLAYGLYHALLIVGYGMLTRPERGPRKPLPLLAARVVTFHLVCFGFLIFSGRLF